MDKHTIRRFRADKAVQDILAIPEASHNLTDFGTRAAVRAQELADENYHPPHSDIFKAREVLAALLPVHHNAEILTGGMDNALFMKCVFAGIDAGRELAADEYQD